MCIKGRDVRERLLYLEEVDKVEVTASALSCGASMPFHFRS